MTAKKVKLIKKQQMSLQEYLHKLLGIIVMGGTDFIPLREVTHFEINNKHGLKDLSVFFVLVWKT